MKTVLAVDDSPSILKDYIRILRKAYNVITASAPSQALTIIESKPVGSIDLLITDLNMPPDIRGDQLIREVYLELRRQEIKFILASNDSEDTVQPYLKQLEKQGVPGVRYLDKAQAGEKLVQLVESAIGR